MAHHTRGLSSVDMSNLDVEGASGSRIEQSYFQGLSLPSLSSWLGEDQYATPWTAAGPITPSRADGGAGFESLLGTTGIVPTAKIHGAWASQGWKDALRFREMGSVVSGSPHIRKTILKGLCLSSAVVLVIFLFEMAYFPAQIFFDEYEHNEHYFQTWADTDEVLWLYPLVAISYFVASSWTVDVAKTATKLKHGRGMSISAAISGVTSTSFRARVLSESFRVFVVINYVLLGLALDHIPWIGSTLCFLMMSFVDAFYCFDPVMVSRGWSVERRLRYVESRWAYMTAFGIVPTIISYFHPSGLLNLFLFMAVYPFYVVLALLARPEPRSASAGSTLTPISGTSDKFMGSESVPAGTTLSSFLPARIPIFLPTVVLYRLVMRFAPRDSGDEGDHGRSIHGSLAGEKSPAYSSAFGSTDRRTAAQFVGGAWAAGGNVGAAQPIWGGQASAWNQQAPQPPPPYPYGQTNGSSGQGGLQYEQNGMAGHYGQSAQAFPPTLAPPPMGNEARSRSGSSAASVSSSSRVGQQRHVHYYDGAMKTPEANGASFAPSATSASFAYAGEPAGQVPPPPKRSGTGAPAVAKGKKSD
ncbi:hypothetical protein BCV69DRAFT_23786 [Microstroma glucosiphilum]|uniref:EI24-domain-containing protein n=1 Tax=Pseudomicrostroma glucosiphilum TaxID=1684307 RepID=A0A316UG47_9BASI|nr:hypothetical protein BCV69DRAFT_23786 [Pseudomicrostroma glucosiphilum]PWN24232.1 hypothetical protein BCV69DRAFT_23786 [Pseudomicrostroma glucosiphilum]